MSFWVSYCGNMTSYRFFKMAAAVAQYYFCFRICWCPCLKKVKICQQTKLRRHPWSTYVNLCLRYNDFWFGKTNVHHIGILLPVRSRPFSRNLHFIMHQSAEFRPNRSSHCGKMTSYLFIKMAAADAKCYFRFRICWYRCLQKFKVYKQTKFRRHISIDGWDLTTSVFEKQTSDILEFYFRFWSRPFLVISMSFCITLPNFVQIGAPTREIWRHFHFSRWRPRPLNTSSDFVFINVTAFRRSKSIRKPNFVNISQLMAEI